MSLLSAYLTWDQFDICHASAVTTLTFIAAPNDVPMLGATMLPYRTSRSVSMATSLAYMIGVSRDIIF